MSTCSLHSVPVHLSVCPFIQPLTVNNQTVLECTAVLVLGLMIRGFTVLLLLG